jgi:prepilin-type processing-associated H-X9-DG protein
METPPVTSVEKPTGDARAFTRVDLLATLTVLLGFALQILSAVAVSRSTSDEEVCSDNLRELTRAWTHFAEDNQGRLPGNPDGEEAQNWANTNRYWAVGWLDNSKFRPDNTNTVILKNAQIGRYLKSVSVFKCPSDPSLSNGRTGTPRVRSVSMNSYLGERGGPYSAGYKQFKTMQSIVDPKPAECFVFIEEREDSINDPWFIVGMTGFDPPQPQRRAIVDYPADWHDNSAVVSFVDGHSETWQWTDPRTSPIHILGNLTLNQLSPDNPDVERIQRASSRRVGK